MRRVTTVEIDGRPATVEDVYRAATWNYGHYTSMQVRGGRVAGLGLHLRRLGEGSAVLFPEAAPPGEQRVRELIRRAVGDRRDASVRVTVLPEPGDRSRTAVMVAVSEAVPDEPSGPLRVRTTTYDRELPHVKHMATLGLTFHAQQARLAGFDDVLFVRGCGAITEGSAWNVAFWDGERVVWPEGPQLAGITMQLLKLGLDRIGVPQASHRLTNPEVSDMRAVSAINSHHPTQPIIEIDGQRYIDGGELSEILHRAWKEIDAEPLSG